MLPIAVPMAAVMELHLPLMVGATLAGAIFDHSSPISDTTIARQPLEHVWAPSRGY